MMDEDRLHEPEDFAAVDGTTMSSTSPYQSTTEPVPHRRSIIGGLILEMHFVKSIAGLLKVVEIIFSIAAAVSTGCVVNCQPCTPVTFMQFVSISAIIMTFLLYVVYALSLHQRADIINWPLTDLIDAMLSCILYLISSSVLAANAITAAEKSAIAFGYLCAILYGASVWFSYKVFIVDYRKRHTTVSHIRGVADHTETETLS